MAHAPTAMTPPRPLVHRSIPPFRRGDVDVLGHFDGTVDFRTMEQALLREPAAS